MPFLFSGKAWRAKKCHPGAVGDRVHFKSPWLMAEQDRCSQTAFDRKVRGYEIAYKTRIERCFMR